MARIKLETYIHAPIEICFDISRDIDVHIESTKHTGETAIAGTTSGLISLGESVTWRAKHLGIWQTLRTRITAFHYPSCFVDEMIDGAFSSMKHEHIFDVQNGQTRMIDIFVFESPLGMLGKLFNALYLTRYMRNLLIHRNNVIKQEAERRATASN